MDEDLKAFRKYLRRINVTSLRLLCSKAGFTEHFPILGDITFSIEDIDLLRRHIGG